MQKEDVKYQFDPIQTSPEMMETVKYWQDLCIAMVGEYSSAYLMHKNRGNDDKANYYRGMADGLAAALRHFESIRINAG